MAEAPLLIPEELGKDLVFMLVHDVRTARL